ncbi:AMP-binding protein [Flavobacteriaceae bacterium]|nr:AMP-binding protein [Flavobacteriaceae bacterium]MDA9015286.1 AMP-binding protein [Flavobacteriaceae bacterium]
MQIPDYTKIHNRFLLNGFSYDRVGLKMVAYSFIKEGDQYEKYLGDFLMDWLDASETIELITSGTTASPKKIRFQKQALVNSAIATGEFFNVNVGDRALHCLPANFIAGKMMLIRAMILGLSLDLVSPSRNPFHKNDKRYDFVAMTPMQAFHSLANMDQVKTLIVGGAFVSKSLQEALLKTQVRAYETYGMTETLSHIAVRTMVDTPSEFRCLPYVEVAQDDRGCLEVTSDLLQVDHFVTNDAIELLEDRRFRLIGRIDEVINSGGVKIHPQQIERKLSQVLSTHFFIGGVADEILGEKVILAVKHSSSLQLNKILEKIKTCKSLEPYEVPKSVIIFPDFIETDSGKIRRKQSLLLDAVSVLDL